MTCRQPHEQVPSVRCPSLPAPATRLRGCAHRGGLTYDPATTCRRHVRVLAARAAVSPRGPQLHRHR